jgi:hypothetical protein
MDVVLKMPLINRVRPHQAFFGSEMLGRIAE